MWLNKVSLPLQSTKQTNKPVYLLIILSFWQKTAEWRVFRSSGVIMSERIKGVVKLQTSYHLLAGPWSTCVTCCRWGWVVVGWTREDVNVLERNKGFFFSSFRDCCPVLIGVFLSVHLILDPLQHLLHPPQLWGETRVGQYHEIIIYTHTTAQITNR